MSLGCACSAGRRWPSFGTVPGLALAVVVDNRPGRGCTAAHGFAAWLEAGPDPVLVDTGPDPELLAANAAVLGLDLAHVGTVVLSHGHDDHSGGLPAVVAARRGRPLRVVMHPAAVRPRFSLRTGTPRPIGMPAASLAALDAPGVAVVPALQPVPIAAGVWATGAIHRDERAAGEPHLALDAGGRRPDPLDDDQAVVVDTAHGLAVVCGCAHAGAAATLERIAALRPAAPIALVAGGLHLGGAADPAIAEVGDLLAGRGCRCALGHCTGERAMRLLAGRLGPRLHHLACGDRLEVP